MSEHDESLDALLERHNVTDVHCVRLRMDDHGVTPRWRAYLSRDHIVSAERMWAGEGPTRDTAIRAAIDAALAGERDDADDDRRGWRYERARG